MTATDRACGDLETLAAGRAAAICDGLFPIALRDVAGTIAAASLVGLALVATVGPSHAGDRPLNTHMAWHEVTPSHARIHFGAPPPIARMLVSDGWASRYEAIIAFTDGTLVYYEASSVPYATQISLQRAFYQVFGPDDVLAEKGIVPHIADVIVANINDRPVAYIAERGKTGVCFAFLSQFAEQSGDRRNRMLHGRVCKKLDETSPAALTQEWLALLGRVVIE
jgi:hypothetical protein